MLRDVIPKHFLRLVYMRFVLIYILLIGLFSCKVTESKISGNYESNYSHTLVLNEDKSFAIVFKDSLAVNINITGKWCILKNAIELKTNDTNQFWECTNLKIKRKRLTRPLHCSPTHRFIIFTRKSE